MLKIILTILCLIVIALAAGILLFQPASKWSLANNVVRTPDARFTNLPDYPFKANYVESLGYRIHYVDEGPRDGETVLLMHGQPSWSYLYRHMIPLLVDQGFRVIAPDNVGFGKSDKPAKPEDHTYQMHVDVMSAFMDAIDLQNATLFAQDWGGLIGLRVVADRPDRFARIMLSNTDLPRMSGVKAWLAYPLFRLAVWREGTVQKLDFEGGELSFSQWVAYARTTDNFDFANLFQNATDRTLSAQELAGYAAPFPSEESLAAVRIFPSLVATQMRENQVTFDNFFTKWDKPFITAFGSEDKLMLGRDKAWQNQVPGAKNQAHTLISGGAHFIQEDKPEELVTLLSQFIRDN